MEITFYLTNQSKKFQDINVNLSIYLIIMLIVYCTFLNIKLIFEFLKTIGGSRGTSCLFEKRNRKKCNKIYTCI